MNYQATAATTTTPRKLINEVPLEERQKRMAVFAKDRRTVLVKFFAIGSLPGLEERQRNEAAIDAKHAEEAKTRGLNLTAYRDKGDTGFCLMQKESVVTAPGLVDQLRLFGLKYTGGHWQIREGKGPVNTLQFSSEGEAVPLPDNILRLLSSSVFNHCTVWCNLKFDDNGAQFRLDTVTLSKRLRLGETSRPARELKIEGSTYRLA